MNKICSHGAIVKLRVIRKKCFSCTNVMRTTGERDGFIGAILFFTGSHHQSVMSLNLPFSHYSFCWG